MIEVHKPGLHTSIQDRGRVGHQHLGVPISGAMDHESANCANLLLGNDLDCALLEITVLGPVLFFKSATSIAVTGAECKCTLDGETIEQYKVISVRSGQRLKIGTCTKGTRVYLAVSGGVQSEEVMGSRSQMKGITSSEFLTKDDKLPIPEPSVIETEAAPSMLNLDTSILQVYSGPEFEQLSKIQRNSLLSHSFEIQQDSNRIGTQLRGVEGLYAHEIITSPVQVGTVQLTPSGTLIVLMRDAPVTGGYARILQLTPEAINALAQKEIRTCVEFELMS